MLSLYLLSDYYYYYYYWLCSPPVWHWAFFSFLILIQSVGHLGRGISPSQGLYLHNRQRKGNKGTQISMPQWEWNPWPQHSKTVHSSTARTLWSDIILQDWECSVFCWFEVITLPYFGISFYFKINGIVSHIFDIKNNTDIKLIKLTHNYLIISNSGTFVNTYKWFTKVMICLSLFFHLIDR